MPKKFFKRIMPDHHKVRHHKHLQLFGTLLHDANIWHLNRKSVAGAFAVGLFIAFVPVPFQMVLAAAAAILFRVNLPLSVGLVWITNPFTMPPMFYGTYKLGAWLLDTPVREFSIQLSFEWLANELAAIWQPFLLGCFIAGTIASIAGYFAIRLIWRWRIVSAWENRLVKRRAIKENKKL